MKYRKPRSQEKQDGGGVEESNHRRRRSRLARQARSAGRSRSTIMVALPFLIVSRRHSKSSAITTEANGADASLPFRLTLGFCIGIYILRVLLGHLYRYIYIYIHTHTPTPHTRVSNSVENMRLQTRPSTDYFVFLFDRFVRFSPNGVHSTLAL